MTTKAKAKAPKIKAITGATALELRKGLKLNQCEFWGPLGVTQSGGSRYESGRSIPRPVQKLLVLYYMLKIDDVSRSWIGGL